MKLGIHPDAFRCRDELFEFGIGYNSPLQLLMVSNACRGNEDLVSLRVSCWCPSTALELYRHPYKEMYVGAEFAVTARLAYRYRKELSMPEKPTVIWASELADRYLQDPECKVTDENRERTEAMHAAARLFALEAPQLPEPVLERLQFDIRAEFQKYH